MNGDILLIDDTPDNLRFLAELLTKAGYSVRKVINGELGLDAARLQPPDIILLDIMMPGMNGYEVCAQLKEDDRTRHIPVIFLSALDEELDKVMAFQTGAVDYITKPFQIVEVLARIETHLQLNRLQHHLQQQNQQLRQEIAQRSSAEAALHQLNQDIESRVNQRTAELEATNAQLRNRQGELEQALVQYQQRNTQQLQWMTGLMQNISTTLTKLTTAVQQLQQEEHSLAVWESLDTIAKNTTLIKQTTQALLLSVGTGTEIPFNPQPLDLPQFCQTLLANWELPEAPPYHLTFRGDSLPALVAIDTILLGQILTQILTNAIDYSPQGGNIQFSLNARANQVIFRLQDEGIGIPADEIERVFEPFYRARNVTPGKLAHFGMGLTIAKLAAEHHGGRISLRSVLSQGTTVTVSLPLRSATARHREG